MRGWSPDSARPHDNTTVLSTPSRLNGTERGYVSIKRGQAGAAVGLRGLDAATEGDLHRPGPQRLPQRAGELRNRDRTQRRGAIDPRSPTPSRRASGDLPKRRNTSSFKMGTERHRCTHPPDFLTQPPKGGPCRAARASRRRKPRASRSRARTRKPAAASTAASRPEPQPTSSARGASVARSGLRLRSRPAPACARPSGAPSADALLGNVRGPCYH